MTADDAGLLTRPDLPAGFDRWQVDLPPRSTCPTSAAEWAGALVQVQAGTLEVGCAAGGHRTFHAGDLLALGWLPIVELRNHGDVAVRLVAVRRRGTVPSDPYLQVTRQRQDR